jgi:glycosyltransferase involved in cell wall biosynthesis
MRIAVVSTPFVSVPPRTYGGTELVVHELVEGLSARGHQVTLFATGDSRTSARLRAIYREPCWPPDVMQDINHVSWAMASIAREPFDLVHAHSAVALAVARLVPGVPVVYTIHHVRDEPLSTFYRHFPEANYVAISEDQARREVALPKLTVIHHGLNPDPYQWRERAADHVCFIGRFSEIKGPHTAMDVAEAAGVPIRVAGEAHPPDREFAEREVFTRMRKPHVSFVGCIGMHEKVPFFRDARALLVPIEWNEPFGLVMIEAMLSGCPVVAFARGSVPEIVEEGITGFIVRDRAEMADVIRPGGPLDHHDRRRCRERAVERFSSARMVERHEQLFQEILSASAGQREVEHRDSSSVGDSQFLSPLGN